MVVYHELRNLPEGEKVIKQYKADRFTELPKDMFYPLINFWSNLKITPRVDRCSFNLTDKGNLVVEGIDKQEEEQLLLCAYSIYLHKFQGNKRRELFNGSCHATLDDFIKDCKQKPDYIKIFLAPKEYRRYCQLISIPVKA